MFATFAVPNYVKSTKTDLLEGAAIGVVLTTASYVVALSAGWITELSVLEAFAVFTSYWCTYLCVRERRFNYPIGAVSTAAYSLLFFQQGLVASMLLNLYLTPALAYGWFRWKRDSETRPVRHLELRWVPAYVIATGLAYWGATSIANAFGGQLALTDSVILVGTMLAQFLLDNKRIETWIVWAIVNVMAIYTYAQAGLALAAFQYVFFLANALYGYWTWEQSRKASKAPATPAELLVK